MSDQKVVDYVLLAEHQTDSLQHQVQAKLKQGWQPLGGAQVATPVLRGEEVAPIYIQTMVKYQ